MNKINTLIEKGVDILFFLALGILFLRPAVFKFNVLNLSISLTSAKNIIILTIVLWWVFISINRFQIKRHTPIDKYLLTFFVWFILCCLFAVDIKRSLEALFVMFIYCSFYLICSHILIDQHKVKTVFYLLLICSIIVALVDLIYHFTVGLNKVIEDYPFWPGKQAVGPFLVFSLLVVSSGLIFDWKDTKIWLRGVSIFSLFLQLLCLGFTYSRGAWISLLFAVGIGVTIILRRGFPIRRLVLLGLFLIVTILTIWIFSLKDKNIRQRIIIWKTALSLVKDNPIIGVGPGNFGYVHLQRYRSPGDEFMWWGENYHAHNLYLQIASETGIVGLLFFILTIWEIVSKGYRMVYKKGNGLIRGMRVGVYMSFIGFLVWSIAESTYTGSFSTLSFFHLNLMIILYISLIFFNEKDNS